MSIWNFLGLPDKKDYDALLGTVEKLTEKEEAAVCQLSTLMQTHMEQQAECQRALLQEIISLQEHLTQMERALTNYSAFTQNQSDNIREQLQELQNQLILHVTDAKASSKHLEQQINDFPAAMQGTITANSDRCLEGIGKIVASISDSNAMLSKKSEEYHAALSSGLRVFSKQQLSAQSDGFSDLEVQIAQLYDLLKCIWLSDLSNSLEGMLPPK